MNLPRNGFPKWNGSLSIVLPAYNESKNILLVIHTLIQYCVKRFSDFEIIIVDDGSLDGTSQVVKIELLNDPRIRLITHAKNIGYGAALNTGFMNATKDWIFFTDSDQQFDVCQLDRFITGLSEYQMVIGYRINRSDHIFRKLNTAIYSKMIIPLLFGIQFKDINCAFKIFPRKILGDLSLLSKGALINAELLTRAVSSNIRILELGVNHFPRKHGRQTGANPKVILKVLLEIIQLRSEILRDKKPFLPCTKHHSKIFLESLPESG